MPFESPEEFWTYAEIAALAARYGSGVLKIGAVVVMVNPRLPDDSIAYFVEYTRARAALAA